MTDFTITAAFLPLIDASILIAARETGLAEAEGIELKLVRETSWASVRDRMAIGHFNVAHMLAPMPIAANLGLTPLSIPTIAPIALGLGGNAITVSSELHTAMGNPETISDPAMVGARLRDCIIERRKNGKPNLIFGIVHPHSSHNFELRYWLAANSINPDTDIDLAILPPSYMAEALAQKTLDGYCVGEPWNTLAVTRGIGKILTTKDAIWKSSPEKVLGVSQDWATHNADALSALLRALYAAAQWCSDPSNRHSLADMLAKDAHLNVDPALLISALDGPAGFEPFAKAATFPWQSHALWFYAQMVRWDQIDHIPAHAETARRTYRSDIYRAALAETAAVLPAASSKVEGALSAPVPVGAMNGKLILGPDGFFDGRIFDPDLVDEYIAAQKPTSTTA